MLPKLLLAIDLLVTDAWTLGCGGGRRRLRNASATTTALYQSERHARTWNSAPGWNTFLHRDSLKFRRYNSHLERQRNFRRIGGTARVTTCDTANSCIGMYAG